MNKNQHHWISTAERMPDEDEGAVAGLWDCEDGMQRVDVCQYDYDDRKWYSLNADEKNERVTLRQPDYWIGLPAMKNNEEQ